MLAAGGLKTYVARAQDLLEASRQNVNPFQNLQVCHCLSVLEAMRCLQVSVPEGVNLDTSTQQGRAQFDQYESLGMADMQYAAFVLVAGGAGAER